MYIRLNYSLNQQIFYYKEKVVELTRNIYQSKDKYCVQTKINMDSHMGTHIDFPAHFYPDGKFGEDYPPEHFMYEHVGLYEINCRENLEITPDRFTEIKCSEIEILILKTGFSHFRDQKKYIYESPVISHQCADFFRKHFPKLRMVGFDMISLTSQLNREEGRKAHLDFLNEKKGEILIMEDMNLKEINFNTNFKNLSVAPLYFDKMDGSPCTVWAQIE